MMVHVYKSWHVQFELVSSMTNLSVWYIFPMVVYTETNKKDVMPIDRADRK